MFPHKPISVLSILTVILILLLCSPWSAMAQFSEQRLIPVAAEGQDNDDDPADENVPAFVDPIGNADRTNTPRTRFCRLRTGT